MCCVTGYIHTHTCARARASACVIVCDCVFVCWCAAAGGGAQAKFDIYYDIDGMEGAACLSGASYSTTRRGTHAYAGTRESDK